MSFRYQSTELGTLPSDWHVDKLASLNPFVTSGSRGWARYYKDTGIPFVRITNLSRASIYLDLSDLRFMVLPDSDREGLRTGLKDGDILVSITADIGIIGYVDGSIEKPAYINQHIALVRCSPGTAETKYLAYFLASERLQRAFRKSSDKGAKAGMNLGGVRRLLVAFPSVVEQRAIATTLSDMDALLAGLERLIAKKRDLKQAVMQQILTGKIRLPGFQGEWEVKRLGEIFQVSVGTSKSAFIADNGDQWICDMGSVSAEGKLIVSKQTNYRGDFLKRGDLIMPKDDIGGGNIIGRVGYIDSDHIYILSDHVYHLRAAAGDSKFLAYAINSHRTNRALRKKGIGSAQLGLGRKSVTEQELQFPPINEQTAIATVLADMDAEFAALNARRDKTRALKQGMMQELLTGRTRLVPTTPP